MNNTEPSQPQTMVPDMTSNELAQKYGLDKPAYRVKELPRKILPIGLTSIYAAANRGELKISKCGKTSFVFADDLARFLDSLRAA